MIFVLFSLYLLGDAFYRWDGFSYYASFSEFLPGVALVSILWSIVAILTAVLIWVLLRVIEWIARSIGYGIKAEHVMVCTGVLIIVGVLVWEGKKLLWPLIHTSQLTKLIVVICVSLLSIFFTWLFRDRAKGWITIIYEHITPLVWLFGMFILVSIPLVTYHTWFKDTDKMILQDIPLPSASDQKRPNIILVTFDALSAKDMSVYGYHKPTTPFITKWAKEATLFTNLQAESNWTTPTTASLMTGKRLWTHMAIHFKGSVPRKSNIESLPLLLKKNGYFNIAIVANTIASVNTLGVANSFDIAPPPIEFSAPRSLFGGRIEAIGIIDKLLYRLFANKIRLHDWIINEDFILGKLLNVISRDVFITTTPPEKVFNRFLTILDNNPPEPFFAWIHILPPHAPYLPSKPYMGMFDNSLELRTYKNQWEIYETRTKYHGYDHFPPEVQPSINILRDRYDEFIRYCDKEFEKFIQLLTEKDKLKKVIVLLSADHGQSFEHAYLAHGGLHLYEQVTNIPLIIKVPMQNETRMIHELVEQIDIPATILDLAGIPIPSWVEGRSLLPLMRGEQLTSRPAFSMNLENNPRRGQQIKRGVISVWEGDYKLIHYLEKGTSLLFNLGQDPGELNNLFKKEPETGQRLLDLIKKNLKEANERIRSGT